MKTLNDVIANRMRQRLSECNMTQKQLADKTFISRGMISAYATGRMTPTLSNALLIAKELHVSIEWLCGMNGCRQGAVWRE